MLHISRLFLLICISMMSLEPAVAGPLFIDFDDSQFPLAAAYENAYSTFKSRQAQLEQAEASLLVAIDQLNDAHSIRDQAEENLATAEFNLSQAESGGNPNEIAVAQEAVHQATAQLRVAQSTARKASITRAKTVAKVAHTESIVNAASLELDLAAQEYFGAAVDQENPLIPNAMDGHSFVFNDVPTGLFIDPPTAYGFEYAMLSTSLFTGIQGFPIGFVDPFTVSADGTDYGPFNVGDTFSFPAGGVSRFTVTGINPLVDPTLPNAFPLQLSFDTPTASFIMTPISQTSSVVPEPTSLALIATGAIGLIGHLCRRKRKVVPSPNP